MICLIMTLPLLYRLILFFSECFTKREGAKFECVCVGGGGIGHDRTYVPHVAKFL